MHTRTLKYACASKSKHRYSYSYRNVRTYDIFLILLYYTILSTYTGNLNFIYCGTGITSAVVVQVDKYLHDKHYLHTAVPVVLQEVCLMQHRYTGTSW